MLKKIAIVAVLAGGSAVLAAPQFTNGSFDTTRSGELNVSSKWVAEAPDHWIAGGEFTVPQVLAGTPDINSVDATQGYPSVLLPSNMSMVTLAQATNSPDGGTWVGLGNIVGNGDFGEQVSQLVADFDIGKTYRISWYHANFGLHTIIDGAVVQLVDSPAAIAVSLDGVKIGNGTYRPVQEGWVEESVEFTATATTHTIGFGSAAIDPATAATADSRSYSSIDGVRITEVRPVVAANPQPVPTLSTLGILGVSAMLGGFAIRRRRIHR
ncbi:IPTL-CTERM sorting domain-containing protein [Lampropedia puyangensis]|uniref:IPTL-CTERM sorting domain-containing protein n=1 Tax=Lampropedia puyangensis TaxID=1330072 RepID=A0A4S8F1A5_9BURK|nr:IPTL-CTERM sorting domain-containing protein [Lampropedia puyangensis]THU01050.1 IPTL-CTERM sorting domain-containing protein [Lampropedia puyangensis]